MNAGDGDDTVDGGRGNDMLVSAWGRDTFVFHSDSGSDTVAGFQLRLQYVNRQSLANLSPSLGNILFDGETSFSDSFEVWADSQQQR